MKSTRTAHWIPALAAVLSSAVAMHAHAHAIAVAHALASAPAAVAQVPPEEFTPDDNLAEDDAHGAPRLSDAQVQAHAKAAASRAPGTVEAFRAFEARVGQTARRVQPTVVALLLKHGEQTGAGSGVLISADGWILTAGHVGLQPGQPVAVYLADGTELQGRTMGQHLDRDEDVGLVKVDPGGRQLPFAELGSMQKLEIGDPLLVFGHPLGPEVKPWRPPPLRVGHVLAKNGTVLGMDAPVSPGDSGGPVFDLSGRVVGITSVASLRPDVNAAVSVDLVKSKLESLRAEVRTGAAPSTDDPGKALVALDKAFAPAARAAQRARRDRVLEVLAPLVMHAADSVVSVMVDSRAVALGVLVDDSGHVLTKASEMGIGPRIVQVAMPDGMTVRAKRIAQDDRLDLILLDTGTTDTDAIVFDDAELDFGSAVISVGPGIEPAAVGFRSLGAYNAGASDQASRSAIGVTLQADGAGAGAGSGAPANAGSVPGLTVVAVLDGSGAQEAGLRAGDVLLVVDGVPMTSADAPAGMLRQHAPGDQVTVEYQRGGERRKASVRLQRSVFEQGPGNVGAALSRRATGFGPVIQHDGVVPAEAMGAPIVDSQGRVVGLNIARADRTKTYALQSSVIKPAVAKLLEAAARGESAEAVDLRTTLKPTKFGSDGRTVLTAVEARLFGPTVAAHAEEDAVAIDGWASPEDIAVWVLDVPAAGRYELQVDVAGVVGGNVDVFMGGELFTVRVPAGPGGAGGGARTGSADYVVMRAGEAFVEEPGRVIVRVQPLDRPHGPIMRLREVRVARLDVVRMFERVLPVLRYRDLERMKREMDREEQKARARKANEGSQEAPPREVPPEDGDGSN